MFLGSITIAGNRFQTNTIIGRDERADGLRHGHLMPSFIGIVNPMNVSLHSHVRHFKQQA